MTLKEQIMKYLLEDSVASLMLKVSIASGSGGGTEFDVAERHAHNVITDHPNETDINVLTHKALNSVFWADLGKVDEEVGSSY